jgi:hypothetical protein
MKIPPEARVTVPPPAAPAVEFTPPKRIVGLEVVNCPIAQAHRSVVTHTYCKESCDHYGGLVEDVQPGNRFVCKYPRQIEIISVYGKQ